MAGYGFDDRIDLSANRRPVFNRSLTIHGSSLDYPQKPIRNHPSLERNGSIKNIYNSPSVDPIATPANSFKGKVQKLCSIFETKSPTSVLDDSHSQMQLPSPVKLKCVDSISKVSSFPDSPTIRLPGTEDRIVVYFTSLRGIRRTYEDCYAVRMIFRVFRVFVDERDISMDSAYKKELQSVLGVKNLTLPQVFIRGKYFGGVDAIKQLHENGELPKILKGLPIRAPGYVCESCGDARFVPCSNCSGSRKLYDEEEDLMKRCLECNENGLIRCPTCCS